LCASDTTTYYWQLPIASVSDRLLIQKSVIVMFSKNYSSGWGEWPLLLIANQVIIFLVLYGSRSRSSGRCTSTSYQLRSWHGAMSLALNWSLFRLQSTLIPQEYMYTNASKLIVHGCARRRGAVSDPSQELLPAHVAPCALPVTGFDCSKTPPVYHHS
jgi:hypothetical protein